MKTDRELLEQALKLVSKYHARETILVDWEKSVIKDIEARLAEDDDEPVAYLMPRHGIRVNCDIEPKEGEPEVPLYLRPQPMARLISGAW